jgi:type IV pilus assembly protein PilV
MMLGRAERLTDMAKTNLSLVPRSQTGLTLLEVLIALLVLSIGMVGIAALHVNGLQNTHSAYYRSVATTIALDFEEQAWLALANNPSICAPDADGNLGAAISALRTPFINLWARENVGSVPLIRLPGMGLNLEIIGVSGRFATVQMDVSWTESRLGEIALDGRESFRHVIRIPCGV